MNSNAIYSKSGKGVQEASGKTSNLARADRAVLSAFDGRLTLADVAERLGRSFDARFEQLVSQLDKDGYIREVSSGTTAAPKPAAGKPAAAPAKPAAPAKAGGEDLDFTIAIPASPTHKPPPKAATMAPAAAARAEADKKVSEDAMTRARREAEERQQKERDKVKAETEAKLRVETEAKMRTEAAQKAKEAEAKAKKDAEEKIRAEADAKVKAAREAAVKAAFEAERKAKEEADRIRKEAEEKARKEAAELQRKLDEERRAREEAERARKEAERKAKEEAERIRREAEEKARREAAELQRKLDEERRAREEAERRAREEAERARKEAERAAREEAERAQKEAERAQKEAEREASEAMERTLREEENRRSAAAEATAEAERAARELIDAQAEQVVQQEKDKETAQAKGGGGFDSLLADLNSFSDREDDDRKAKEEAERKGKEEKARRQREEAEAQAREAAEKKKREAAELERQLEEERKKDEAKRKEREEEAARKAREEEEQDRKRKRREEEAAKEAASGKSDDIGVSDDDLGMDDVKADQEQVSKESRKAQRAREKEAKEREREARERAREVKREEKRAAAGPAAPPVGGYRPIRRRGSWGKPIALLLFVLLVGGVGWLHVMPINTQEYEKAASDAIGVPVRIGTARLSLYKGVVLTLENVAIGDAKIPSARAFPELGSLFDERKMFSRIELDGVTLPQEEAGAFLNVKLRSDKFYVGRIVANKVKMPGPLPLPTLDADVAVGGQGSVGKIELRGPDNLVALLTPRGADVDFEATASGFPIPFLPDVTLSTFAMRGRATRESARIDSWGGAIVGGAVNGNANVRWANSTWNLDGTMTLRGINAATFAPALLSEGNAEGTARFSMSDADPSKFKQRGRVEGNFSMNRGVLGSFDLSRAILTGGRQATGRTPFIELTGQGVYDRGAVTLRNVTFGAGAMNATANAEISPEGALSGRIVADIKTAAQQLRATINVGGTVGEPQVK